MIPPTRLRRLATSLYVALLVLAPLRLLAACPAEGDALGFSPLPTGAVFRVWAPNADAVHVAGTFNDWNPSASPLCRQGDGVWSAVITNAAAGDAYKYVVINGDRVLWRQDPVGPVLANTGEDSAGNSIAARADAYPWQSPPPTLASREQTIIYELHVGTFHDPTPADDAMATFADVAARLPYLADLGITAIELLPISEFSGKRSWGYNPTAPYAVESDYGGPAALQALIDACHAHGIGVILDVVYNHWGPTDMTTWQFDGWSVSNRGGIYFYPDERGDTPWGPRPDFSRPEVRDYILDNVRHWFTDYRADGLRWDATAFIRNRHGSNDDPSHDLPHGWTLLQDGNVAIDAIAPQALSIAEDMQGNPWLTKPRSAGGAAFDSQWDGAFVYLVRPALEIREDAERNMEAVRDAIAGRAGDPFARVIFTESHDAVANGSKRVSSSIDVDDPGSYWARKRSTLGAVLLLTSPGIPMLFQGQEFLEDGWFSDTDPVDWSKTNTFAGVHALYRDLNALRRNLDGNTAGLSGPYVTVHHVNNADKVIAYHRWDAGGPGDDVIVIANFANRAWPADEEYRVGFPHPGTWQVRLNSDAHRYGDDYGNTAPAELTAEPIPWNSMPCSASVPLAPYSALVLSQAPAPVP